jgi:dipeptidyl aminopeptidase/acylaminoacyl peptidase
MSKLVILSVFISAVVAGVVGYGFVHLSKEEVTIIGTEPTPYPTPLARYEIVNLAKTDIPEGTIEIVDTIKEEEKYISYLFEHKFDPTFSTGDEKTVTGQINIPKEEGIYPIVFMIRGYVDQSIYETGIGTRTAAAQFAENGFITIAPDFLGYGTSSPEADNIYETRFQTYTTVLSLLSSVEGLTHYDKKNVFLWAHSNGGQIALTVLAISEKAFPTTLWAPVTKPFPYSVLYYTDQSADGGRLIRQELAKLEERYNVNGFTFTNYLDKIKGPLQLHQGGADDAIPVSWSDSFVAEIRSLNIEMEYSYYPNADHNMQPNWNTAIERDMVFFASNIEK